MTEQEAKRIFQAAAERVCAEETEKLNALYSLRPDALREKERIELSNLALLLRGCAEKQMTAAMRDAGLKYVNTSWQGVSETLPQISYVFIDWDSFDNSPRKIIEQEIPAQEFKRAMNGKPILIAAGALAVGSVVLLWVTVPGQILRKIAVIALVTAVAVAGFVGLKMLTATKESKVQKPAAPMRSDPSIGSAQIAGAIRIAKDQNIHNIREWTNMLADAAFKIWQEDFEG
ncbi:MAG: hypothetical protein IK118_08415 [Clostridia bacterium]|nr:hypothetical protein [Clostridia bacterium]